MDNKVLNRKPGYSTAAKSATEVSEDRPSLPWRRSWKPDLPAPIDRLGPFVIWTGRPITLIAN